MTLRLAIRNLFRSPRRSLLIFATLAAGAGALCLFRAFNAGLLSEYRQASIHSRYGHGMVLPKDYWGETLEKPTDHWIQEPKVLLSQLQALAPVKGVYPRVSFPALISSGNTSFSGLATGVDGSVEKEFFDRLKINSGTALDGDPEGILVGAGLASALGSEIGSSLTVLVTTVHGSINAESFVVKGIFETGVKAIDDVSFRVELSAGQQLLDTPAVESVSIGLHRDDDWPLVASALSQNSSIEALSFEELDQTYYQNGVVWLKKQSGVFELIILVIVLLGVFNAVAVSILERRVEFTTARANGEGRWSLFRGLVLEALMLGGVSCVAGILGVWALGKFVLATGIPMPPPPGMTLASLVFLEFSSGDALVVSALCMGTVALGTAVMGARVLRGPIVRGLLGV